MQKLTNITPYLIQMETSLYDTLEKFNSLAPNVFMLVENQEGQLQGTITDGDVRRGLINGMKLSDEIHHIMNKNPIFLKKDEIPDTNLITRLQFIPVVDSTHKPIAIYIDRNTTPLIENALIMAGGLGKRLYPKTILTPKPLIPIAGKPILERILEKFDTYQIPQTFISVHYKADQFETYLEKFKGNTNIQLVHETEMLGTAGCISLIKDQVNKPLLITNGDILSSLNFDSFASYHIENEYDVTLAVTLYETLIPYGVITTNENDEFENVTEKPTLTHMVAAGVYIVSKPLLDLIQLNEKIDMPDLLERAKSHKLRIGIYPFHEYWRDIGRPDDLQQAGFDLEHSEDI